MILLCDEEIGSKIPQALYLVGLETMSLHQAGWRTRPDIEWLTEADRRRFLILSCDKKMLEVVDERDTLIREKVWIVVLTSGNENLPNTLRLLLSKWSWLEDIDRLEQMPFAYFLYPRGRTVRQNLN